VKLIATSGGNLPALAAKAGTTTIPIVFAVGPPRIGDSTAGAADGLAGYRASQHRHVRHERSEILPRRPHGRDGASVVRRDAAMNRTEDLNVKICEATTSCIIRSVCTALKLCATNRWRPQDQEGGADLKAVSRHRDVAIVLGVYDCRNDEDAILDGRATNLTLNALIRRLPWNWAEQRALLRISG
jgi:hypothetical protein